MAALVDRFGDLLRAGTPSGPLAVFLAKHPAVGDATVGGSVTETHESLSVTIAVGRIVGDDFANYDAHLDATERAGRLTKDVVRFLEQLFADRLLMWRSTDGRVQGWRERGEGGNLEPLVLDNRPYETYLWSAPLGIWRAIPAILARCHIRDEREYQIVMQHLRDPGPDALQESTRRLAGELVAQYERRGAPENPSAPT